MEISLIFFVVFRLASGSPIEEFPQPADKDLNMTVEVLRHENPTKLPLGENVTLICKTKWMSSHMLWTFNENNVSEQDGFKLEMESENINKESGNKFEVSILHILNLGFDHAGRYVCHAANLNASELDLADIELNVTKTVTILSTTPVIYTKIYQTVNLVCVFDGYPIDNVNWFKDGNLLPADMWNNTRVNKTVTESELRMQVTKNDNGTYVCAAGNDLSNVNASTAILVLDKPQVTIDVIKPIGTNKIFLNWTVNDGNSPKELKYIIQYKSDNDSEWMYYRSDLNNTANSVILTVEKNESYYTVRLMAKNPQGDSHYATSKALKMLDEEPIFVPEVTVTGVTSSSITVKWSTPPVKFKDHIHYYNLVLRSYNTSHKLEAMQPATRDYLYMFSELNSATVYNFQVAGCSDYSRACGPWSAVVNGTTMDGISGPPFNPSVDCRFDNISHTNFVVVGWEPPKQPHGSIQSYNVNLEGSATFRNELGLEERVTWGPKVTSTSEKTHNARFYNVSANTNYTVKISGVTRLRKNGLAVALSCAMPPALPDKQMMGRVRWKKMAAAQQGKWLLELSLSRVSERNGPICCYRIYVVRMEAQQKLSDLPAPHDSSVGSYQEAHRTPRGGAYVAEMFSSSNFRSEVFLGDEQVYNASSDRECDACVGLRPYNSPPADPKNDKQKPHGVGGGDMANRVRRSLTDPLPPFDGSLDIDSNYTGFVEIVVGGGMAAYSGYFDMLNPGPEVVAAPRARTLGLVFQVLCGLMVVIFVLLGVLCVLHRYTKQAHAQAVEMITFRTSLRNLRGRQRLVSLNPPDMGPLKKSELVSAYIQHHRDSDYGFQQEFELLPDRFSDRTTRASDNKENLFKNRYPDIKAYDQTRVKLAQIDGVAGSDYVNANFVLGYKERKKFICAQGPMDTTVNDFWRMIWEQGLQMLLMLTNLEEYSKTKCAKYWPDATDGDRVFGKITLSHLHESRYSDYVVRELKMVRCANGRDVEERRITQYHYLVWKDFTAPEHPSGIIRFIKRVNEAYSIEKGCILVHCSAGVGRTGTLVALDCLLQQLKEEEQVAIFNTICDLRHQRNFLVQSLKQYIFIYRALMEVAQYGDTELAGDDLKAALERLRHRGDAASDKCKLEEEFDNLVDAFEERKSCAVASGDENRDKNRSDAVLPYDRNRVILTPLAGKEHSTYINASFVDGYDDRESFIIAQDPTETTVEDFWRMISEQGVGLVVMMSEVGEGRCARYWPEEGGEAVYDHVTVKYSHAETCPYYTRREFYVKGRGDGEERKVTHLQYHGWPTVDGEVPEVTRGLTELVDYCQSVVVRSTCAPSMAVHCDSGSDRSSLFVGLSVLVQQLRTERRVDVFTVTRKLRSQRQGLVSSYAQYEFLHRAIVNYAELHGLCES